MVALLAAAYWLTGKLGQLVAIPPGYATVIWPPGGIMLAALLMYGRRVWPGVLLGAFLLNLTNGDLALADMLRSHALLLATCISAGQTLQVVLACEVITRRFGRPIRLASYQDVLRLLAIAGPLACLVSPTAGIISLYAFGKLGTDAMLSNWLTWWSGDVFGVVVFMPLVMLLPAGAQAISWRGQALRGVHAIALTLLVIPLAITFYAWRYLEESSHRQSQAHFETLAKESEQALITRITNYANATRGGAGVFQSSEFVSRDEWRTFTESLRLRDDYPGMLGLGWIERVGNVQKAEFLERVRNDGAPGFRIHPNDEGASIDVVTYIEPELTNGAVLGRNITLDPRMSEAADRAAASGLATLTQPIGGIDEDVAPRFLLLQAVYANGAPLDNPQQRRRALRGFVYTPFLADGLLSNLTLSQGRSLDISMFDAADEVGPPIYSTRLARAEPWFGIQREIQVYGQTWILNWQSTPAFERGEHSHGALFVLFGGLLFTALFAVLLVVFGIRREDIKARGPLEQPWILPLATLLLVGGASLAAYAKLLSVGSAGVSSMVESEARRIDARLERATRIRMQSLTRMAHRWAAGGGTSYAVWRADARDHIREIDGLEELQWLGPDYRVIWAEGARRSGWVENRDLSAYSGLAGKLAEAAEKGSPFVTEPREFAPGESAFIVYVPLMRAGQFDGFLVAVFSNRGFFRNVLDPAAGDTVAFRVKYGGVTFFDNGEAPVDNPDWTRELPFLVHDRPWTFTVSASQDFVDTDPSLLPLIVLVAGLLIAVLSSVLVRYVMLTRLRTARLQASTAALAESDERHALVMRGMAVGVWEWDVATNKLTASEKSREILGISPEQEVLTYEGFASRLHPEDRGRVERAIFGHVRGVGVYDTEFRLRRNDGEYVWVHASGQAQMREDGSAGRMVGSIQDITHKKRQQQELERSESQLRLLIENTPAAVAMFDSEMRYIMTSRRWLEDYRLEERDIIGVSHYDVFPEIRKMPSWIDIHQRALRGERFDMREDCWVRSDGSREWNQWAIHPWHDGTGKVGGIVMFTEVITARKVAESALRTSEAVNRAAMDKAPIGKAVVLPNGRFMKVNPALCQLLGHSEQELMAMDFQALTHPDDLESSLANFRALLSGKAASSQFEKRYLHRDGRVIWALLSMSLVRRPDGEADFVVTQVQDITERKVFDRISQDLSTVVTQELREPLASIREALQGIAQLPEAGLPAPVKQLFDVCDNNCERLTRLVDAILDLEKLSSGELRFTFRDEPIAQITRRAVESNALLARKLDVNFVIGEIDPDVTVYVDDQRYAQVLANLLSNAAKFSPPGSTIEINAALRGEWVRVEVHDHGRGIPEDFRSRIFSKFSHADSGEARHKGGVGLGLYITRQLVEQMRGNIGFSSETGAGTTFWVEFPCVTRGHRQKRA